MKDNDPTMAADEDLRAGETACEPEAAETPEGGEAAPDSFELELDGQVHTLPIALKGAFLRQADYTRKTQELAEQRRAVEAERAAAAGAMGDQAHLAALDHHLAAFGRVDWPALAQAEPDRALALLDRYQRASALRDRYAQAVGRHESRGRLAAEREAAEAMAQTGRALARDIPGWSPELAAKLADYALAQGVTPEELKAASDPRIWKVLHKAFQAEHAAAGGGAANAPAVRPAVIVTGAAAGSGGVRDELGTKEWMRRRNEQLRKGR
jgi:hypothetical protein